MNFVSVFVIIAKPMPTTLHDIIGMSPPYMQNNFFYFNLTFKIIIFNKNKLLLKILIKQHLNPKLFIKKNNLIHYITSLDGQYLIFFLTR